MRRFHGYCLSAPRSGTHSISYIFEKACHSAHEPFASQTIQLTLAYCKGEIDKSTLYDALIERDAIAQWEMEASHYLHHLSGALVDLFPMAHFILTVRDPLSWIQSEVNQNVITSEARFAIWQELEAFRYGRYDIKRPEKEKALGNWRNVWPLVSYFKYWSEHYTTVLDRVPEERLLVFPIWEIESNGDKMCRFLGFDISSMEFDVARAHVGHSKKLFDLYSHIDRDYVAELAEEQCGDVVCRLTDLVPSFALRQEKFRNVPLDVKKS